jgi:glycosyltransferase involved in cell wall biosynthesis
MTLIALLQARNEQRFLPGWLENVTPSVDEIIALDDGSTDATREILRAHPKVLEVLDNPPGQPWDERGNQMALIQAGRRHGAGWFLCIDADERLEQGFAAQVGNLLQAADADNIHVYSFQLRELWGDRRHYRSDGEWNSKARYRMFRNNPTHRRFDPRPIHRFWPPFELTSNFATCGRHSELNLYHLRMIAPIDRTGRVTRYEQLDPQHLYEPSGYRYLLDEIGLQRTKIPPMRDFLPYYEPAILQNDTEYATD